MKNRIFTSLLPVLIGFVAMLALLFFERLGILYGETEKNIDILPKESITHIKESGNANRCLLVIDSEREDSMDGKEVYEQVLTDMRVPYDIYDFASDDAGEFINTINEYSTVVFSIVNYEIMGEDILDIPEWVGNGGRALIGIPPELSDNFMLITPMMGMTDIVDGYGLVDNFTSDEDFMLGAQKTYGIMDAYESSAIVVLDSKSRVYASASDGRLPIVWSRDYKDGRFVVCNFGYMERGYRGVYSSAYSLLDDVFIYPVINGSTFYLDDFPSPVPAGDGEYIQRDYGLNTAEFYSTVWWPDLLALGEKHDIRYTGLLIETYEDKTYGDLPSNGNTADYYYFGNMLLNRGGELGYHGYNHQPLCLSEDIYKEDLGYNVWENKDTMKKAFNELIRFSTGLFPSADMSVYVPPSDVLSREGREMLGKEIPEIRAIASIYLTGPDEYTQEFTVAEDGMVETPRIISGGIIDDYMKFVAFSELNLHYAGSHFMHPDDLLDEDRGAEMGWEAYKHNVDDYMTWMDESAPDIRHVTGSGMAGAVQRFTNVVPEYSYDESSITLNTDGLIDSAYFFVRVNEGEMGEVYGGDIIKLNDSLYLLKALSPKVVMTRKGNGSE